MRGVRDIPTKSRLNGGTTTTTAAAAAHPLVVLVGDYLEEFEDVDDATGAQLKGGDKINKMHAIDGSSLKLSPWPVDR